MIYLYSLENKINDEIGVKLAATFPQPFFCISLLAGGIGRKFSLLKKMNKVKLVSVKF